MKYTVEMSSGAVAYIPIFINIGRGIHRLKAGIRRRREQCHLVSLIFF
jgi:hypothetical protein